VQGSRDQVDLGESCGVCRVQELRGGAEAERFRQGSSTVVGCHWNGQGNVHVDAWKNRGQVSGLAMEWIAVQQDDLQAGKARFDKQLPQTERVRKCHVFVWVAEAAVNLQRHAELAALFRGLEQQRVA